MKDELICASCGGKFSLTPEGKKVYEEEKPAHLTEMIAEKITFLSNKNGKEENKDEE
jgi:hypothetical protein